MKNLTDFISEQLIMELSSDTYKNAANTAKARGEFDRALKFTRAALNSEIEELKKKYKKQEEYDKDNARNYSIMHQDVQYSAYDWYRDYHKELIKLIHSDDVLEVSHGLILFKSGLLIGGIDINSAGQVFLPINYNEKTGLSVYVTYRKIIRGKIDKSSFIPYIWVSTKDANSKNFLIKKAKEQNMPQEIIDQAIDFCKKFGFME